MNSCMVPSESLNALASQQSCLLVPDHGNDFMSYRTRPSIKQAALGNAAAIRTTLCYAIMLDKTTANAVAAYILATTAPSALAIATQILAVIASIAVHVATCNLAITALAVVTARV